MSALDPGSVTQRVRLADCAPQPWRNGGGVTRELLAWEPSVTRPTAPVDPLTSIAKVDPRTAITQADSRTPTDWSVRVSVADISHDRPFSIFPGTDRGFAVLQGAGVDLDLPGGTRRQKVGEPPLHFSGDTPVNCRLLAGPTRDLNLMGRRSAGRITIWHASAGSVLDDRALWRALFTFGSAAADFGAGIETLEAGTLCWLGAEVDCRWQLIQGEEAFWMTLVNTETTT